MRRMKAVNIELSVQNASHIAEIPEFSCFKCWISSALRDECKEAEITLRIVDPSEMTQLNLRFRGKNESTNVLAFPLEASPLIGDVVMCAEVVLDEAKVQQKQIEAHWAHLTIHGTLHLMGYDHITPSEAEVMQGLEI